LNEDPKVVTILHDALKKGWLSRSEQATAPLCMSPRPFCGIHVRREFLGDMDGARWVSPAPVKEAKKRTGIEADTDLIEFALVKRRARRHLP